nr:N-acetylmuramoyl-L-alanine amidase [Paenibacillus sp. MER TA 81-3]
MIHVHRDERCCYSGVSRRAARRNHEPLKPFGVRDRGQKKKDLYVCRESLMPAVLTENLFVDVAADAARLKRPEVIEAIVVGHVAGVAKYLKLQPKKAQQPPASGATNILGPA